MVSPHKEAVAGSTKKSGLDTCASGVVRLSSRRLASYACASSATRVDRVFPM